MPSVAHDLQDRRQDKLKQRPRPKTGIPRPLRPLPKSKNQSSFLRRQLRPNAFCVGAAASACASTRILVCMFRVEVLGLGARGLGFGI